MEGQGSAQKQTRAWPEPTQYSRTIVFLVDIIRGSAIVRLGEFRIRVYAFFRAVEPLLGYVLAPQFFSWIFSLK